VGDRVVHEVRDQLQQQRARPGRGGDVAGGLDGDAALLREGQERFGGFFREEGQVEVFVRGHAGGVRDAGQRREHAAGEDPPSHETEHQLERQHHGCRCTEDA
jgi:hypothetical protein